MCSESDTAGILDDATMGLIPTGLTRDEVFYFQNVTFQVGKTLFRVPKNLFNVPGTVFEAMFALPPTPDVEGSSDGNPIVLNVDEDYFRGFLRVVCGPRGQLEYLSDEDWLMALDLATLWTFKDIRRVAIQSLDGWTKTQSLKQVVLVAKKNNIGSWLKLAYTQLALQDPLPFETLINPPALDWETVARLLYAQKSLRPKPNNPVDNGPFGNSFFGSSFGNSFVGNGCFQCSKGKLCCGRIDSSILDIFKAEFERMTPVDPNLKEGVDNDAIVDLHISSPTLSATPSMNLTEGVDNDDLHISSPTLSAPSSTEANRRRRKKR